VSASKASTEDGRRQRSEASRQRIVAAMLELVREGVRMPSAEQVAERGQVGLRTVFRHFDNMESLYREMNAAMMVELAPLIAKPFDAKTWRENMFEMIARRSDLFERIMPIKIAADLHRHTSKFLASQAAHQANEQRESMLRVLPKELRGQRDLVDALDLTLSFDTWRRLRMEQSLSPQRARKVIETMVEKLL